MSSSDEPLISMNKPWPTAAQVAAKYNALTPEEKRSIDRRIEMLDDADITAMRLADLKIWLSTCQIQILDAMIKAGEASARCGGPVWNPINITPKLEIAALSWYKVNEFWERVKQ